MSDHTMVFIVDDDAAVRDALAMLLEAAGYPVATFPAASDFLDTCTPSTQGCIILDVDMPEMDGPTLQVELIRRGLQLPVIFLTGKGTIPVTVRAMKAGAIDFLTKPVEGSMLLARVKEALEKGSWQLKRALANQSGSSQLEKLTRREREVMVLAVAGHTSKEIAQRLGISYRTVEIHRAHVMQKTGAANLLELARMANALESRRTPRQMPLPHT
jgi:FixJ family two-component response regulator